MLSRIKKDFILSQVILISILFCPPLIAAENLFFEGTLISPPPCKIGGGDLIDINFGERIGINKVDGVNYLETIKYEITCEDDAVGLDLTLTLSGPKVNYDNAVLQSNLMGLGIKVLQDGHPFILDKSIIVDPKKPPKLEAVPVKMPGATLTADAFVVMAVLLAEYQ